MPAADSTRDESEDGAKESSGAESESSANGPVCMAECEAAGTGTAPTTPLLMLPLEKEPLDPVIQTQTQHTRGLEQGLGGKGRTTQYERIRRSTNEGRLRIQRRGHEGIRHERASSRIVASQTSMHKQKERKERLAHNRIAIIVSLRHSRLYGDVLRLGVKMTPPIDDAMSLQLSPV